MNQRARDFFSSFFTSFFCLLLATPGYAKNNNEADVSAFDLKGNLEFSPCKIKLDGRSRELECATQSVPENWNDVKGKNIELSVIRIPAQRQRERSQDAVVFLAGGPGQAASKAFFYADKIFPDLLRNRDFYLIDQRGTGRSSPLECTEYREAFEEATLSGNSSEVSNLTMLCLAEMESDVRFYTSEQSARDLEQIRIALRLPSWNIFSVSYGTRLAYRYAQLFPDSVRTMILDSVVPPDHVLGSQATAQSERALEKLFAECRLANDCNKRYEELLSNFSNKLHDVKSKNKLVNFENIQTGKLEKKSLGFDQVLSYIRFALYSAETRAVLLNVLNEALVSDNFAPIARAGLIQEKNIEQSVSPLLHYAVACSEDYPKLKIMDQNNEIQHDTYLGRRIVDAMFKVCGVWPRIETADAEETFPVLPIPTIMLSGELDPITPKEYAVNMQKFLPNSEIFVLRGRGHSVAHYGCAPKIMARFVKNADISHLNGECLERLHNLPIFLNANGFSP